MSARLAAFVLFLSLSILSSCSDPSNIGLELDPNTNQIGVFYAEIPLSASLVWVDSLNTTNARLLVAGGDNSPFFGRTESIAYSRMAFNQAATKPDENAIFDSAKFDLQVAMITAENLDELKTFTVHRLQEPILDTAYYNFSHLAFDEDPFASGSFQFTANSDTTVSMEMEEGLAVDLFTKLTQNDPVFSDIFAFRDYFPGIALKGNPDEETTLSVQIGSGSGMKIYYHEEGDTVSSSYAIAPVQSRHFNGVLSDRTGTPTEAVQERNTAYEVGNLVGGKSNLGMVVKLDMEPLSEFLDTIPNVTFNQVSLEMGPTENFPSSKLPPNNLVMYFTDDSNKILRRAADGALLAVQSNNSSQVATDADGNIVPAASAGGTTALAFDSEGFIYQQQLTAYVNALFRSGLMRTDLLLYPRTPNNQTQSISNDVVRSMREYLVNQNTIKLKIYYSKMR